MPLWLFEINPHVQEPNALASMYVGTKSDS